MDLRQLKYFVCIVELRSFTKAAERLYVAQPALGAQIKRLENELGQELLFRHSRGVEPTESGWTLYNYATRLLAEADNIHQVMRDFNGPPCGSVSFGTQPNATTMLTVNVAKQCLEAFPDIKLNLTEGYSIVLLQWVTEGKLDLACIFNTPETSGVSIEPLFSEEFCLIGPATGISGIDEAVDFKKISEYRLIVPGATHTLRRMLEQAARASNTDLNICVEAESQSLVLELVARGIGYTVLPYSSVAKQVEWGELTAYRIEPELAGKMHLVYREPMSKAANAVADLIRNSVKNNLGTRNKGWHPSLEVMV